MCCRRFAYVTVALVALLGGSFRPALGQDARATCDLVLEFIPDFPGLVLSSRDTLATDTFTGERLPGCSLRLTGPSADLSFRNTPHSVLRRELPQAGWLSVVERMADGPDGTVFGMRKNSILCLISAEWDGGDDSDPDYVPENRYELVISCFEESTAHENESAT